MQSNYETVLKGVWQASRAAQIKKIKAIDEIISLVSVQFAFRQREPLLWSIWKTKVFWQTRPRPSSTNSRSSNRSSPPFSSLAAPPVRCNTTEITGRSVFEDAKSIRGTLSDYSGTVWILRSRRRYHDSCLKIYIFLNIKKEIFSILYWSSGFLQDRRLASCRHKKFLVCLFVLLFTVHYFRNRFSEEG